jgi:hypothetical protein
MPQLRKKVDFRTNVPVQVALAYDDGILKQDGRFGDYWIYSLQDERVMFVPPPVHEQIQKLHITRGQAFLVTKQEKRIGNKRAIEWMVEFPEDPAKAQAGSSRAACSPRTEPEKPVPPLLAEADQVRPAEIATAEPKQEDAPAPASTVATPEAPAGHATDCPPGSDAAGKTNGAAKSNGTTKPNGDAKLNGAARSPDPAGTEKNNTSPLFRASMRAAIDALIDAEAYAAKKNYSVRFTNEDLRATAISIFIAVREGYSR